MPGSKAVDEVLKARLVEYLGHLESALKQGGDPAATQLPDMVQQMVAYHLGYALAGVACGLVALGVGWWGARWFRKHWGSLGRSNQPTVVILAVPFLVGVLLVLVNGNTVLKCWLAPKYFILEQIIALTK